MPPSGKNNRKKKGAAATRSSSNNTTQEIAPVVPSNANVGGGDAHSLHLAEMAEMAQVLLAMQESMRLAASEEQLNQRKATLFEYLSSEGLVPEDVDGDGNCLFRGGAKLLFPGISGDKYEAMQSFLRAEVCAWMKENKSLVTPFLPSSGIDDGGVEIVNGGISIDEHISKMEKDGECGDNMEIVAIGARFKRVVIVYERPWEAPYVFELPRDVVPSGPPLLYARINFNHFVALHPMESEEDGGVSASASMPVANNSVDGVEYSLAQVFNVEDLNKPQPVMCSNCGLVACSRWNSNGTSKSVCYDCQLGIFNGWPTKRSELPIDCFSHELGATIADKCSLFDKVEMPACLPRKLPGETPLFDNEPSRVLDAMPLVPTLLNVGSSILKGDVDQSNIALKYAESFLQLASKACTADEWKEVFVESWKHPLVMEMQVLFEDLPDIFPQLGPDPSLEDLLLAYLTHYGTHNCAAAAPEIRDALNKLLGRGFKDQLGNLTHDENPCVNEALVNMVTGPVRDVLRGHLGVPNTTNIPARRAAATLIDAQLVSMRPPPSKHSDGSYLSKREREKHLEKQEKIVLTRCNSTRNDLLFLSVCNLFGSALYKFLATSEPLLCQPMSPIYKEMFTIDGITSTLQGWIFDLQPRLPHMQNNVSKFSFATYKVPTLKQYDTTLLDTAMKAGFFTDEELAQIASLEEEVKISFYQNKKYNKMSEEDIILYEANMKQLRQKMAAMPGDSAFVYHTAKEDGESEENALKMIEELLSPGHFRGYLGNLTGARVGSLATVFSRKFEELDDDVKASHDAFSSEVSSRIIPLLDKEEKKKYKFLLKHYNLEDLLPKMKSKQDGAEKGGAVTTVAAAFSRVFEELDDDVQASHDAFSSNITNLILPHLEADERSTYNNLIKQYNKPEDLLSKMKSCQTRRSSYDKGMKQVKTNATGRKIGSGGHNEDPCMNTAVEAKLATPSLNHYQALVAGGFDFKSPELNKTGRCTGEPKGTVTDKDGRTYKYRKDKLSERLKRTAARKAAEKEGRSYTARGGIQDVKAANQPTTSATMSGVVTSKSTASSKTTKSGDKRKAGDLSGDKRKAGDFFKVDKKEEKKKKPKKLDSSTLGSEGKPSAVRREGNLKKKAAPKKKVTRSKSSVGTSSNSASMPSKSRQPKKKGYFDEWDCGHCGTSNLSIYLNCSNCEHNKYEDDIIKRMGG